MRRQASGFALIVAISLMSFIILMLLSLSTLVSVELATTQQSKAQLTARENARFALMVALGELQKHAGPDQRVTARAEILDNPDTNQNEIANPHWLGVWNVEDDTRTMLVSGDNVDPTIVPSESTIITSGNVSVNVPLVEAPDLNGLYGYWIRDEGLKASLGLSDKTDDIGLRSTPTQQDRYQRAAGQIFGFQDFIREEGISDFNQSEENTVGYLDRITQLHELRLIPSLSESTMNTWLQNNAESFTSTNLFTLTNTLDGGLRQDLSHLKRLPATTSQVELDATYDNPQWDMLTERLHDFIRFNQDNTADVLTPNVDEDHMDDPIIFSTAPYVSELAIVCGLGARSLPNSGGVAGGPTRDIYLYFYIFGDVLSPYTRNLNLDNGKDILPTSIDPTAKSDISIVVSNFPEIRLINSTKRSTTTINEVGTTDPIVIEGSLNSFYEHKAGYMRPCSQPSGSYESGRGTIAYKIGELRVTPETWDVFKVRFGNVADNPDPEVEGLTISLRESNTNDTTPREFQRIVLRNWGDFEIEYDASNSDNDTRFVRGISAMDRSHLSSGNWTFGVHYRLDDEWNETVATGSEQLDEMLSEWDMRAPKITVDLNNPEDGDGKYLDVFSPDDLERLNFMTTTDVFQGAWTGNDTNNRLARIYDLPKTEMISIGALNELHFVGRKPKPLGNTVAGKDTANLTDTNGDGDFNDPEESLNNYFDRYFFSTLPNQPNSWSKDTPLPNTRIRHFEHFDGTSNLGNEDSATNLMVEGGLNVNSTSDNAWRALLSPAFIDDFSYTNDLGTTVAQTLNIERPFFNYPFTSGEGLADSRGRYYGYISGNQDKALGTNIKADGTHEVFLQGFRELSATETRELAEEIVDGIQRYCVNEGHPFYSLTEFANSGVLQDAIDAVPSINSPDGKHIPKLSPGYLSAGSIMNMVSPYVFARSDTFKIRSYGETRNPITDKIEATAQCEIVVQRMPDVLSPTLGRRFEIVAFEWINESDI
ncbi:hypothetical protein [Rubellicoccus peritrichatus]|uniref:Uncharacterized protein n=1 Tax=Rubellicoccus peritrichatus TaxID=3080537 RepID=A0AAQ3QUQ6_9BACT|nr:hypothetical protein [Puniceicoccus sp. CR14]WOO42631.1 hypothetical protein RZN69_05970 [Puniceicoccus sp. CR14]